jgi:hypothetical protein
MRPCSNVVSLFVLANLVGCGSEKSGLGPSPNDAAVASPDSSSDSQPDGFLDGPSDGPCALDAFPGIRICCGRPNDLPGANCILLSTLEYYATTCVLEDQGFDLKNRSLGEHCCGGLVAVRDSTLLADGTCEVAPPSVAVCLPCGDGICAANEDRCSCPVDCP